MTTKQIFKYLIVALIAVFIYRFANPIMRLGFGNDISQKYMSGTDSFIGGPGQDMMVSKSALLPMAEISTNTGGPRMTTLDTSAVLIVKNIETALKDLQEEVITVGGYVVSKTINSQQEGGYGSLNARVPRDKSNELINFLKENSLKVININENGYDITEEFTDTQARLETLTETKTAIEEILQGARTSKDINALLAAQKEIINIQTQIDQEKGREKYLDELSKTVSVTAEFRTDEYALPYNPDTGWAPEKIFKNAVRSLVLFARNVGTFAIWAFVYLPVIFIGLVLALAVRRVWRKYTSRS